jgi:hypothetical protein
MWQRLYSYFYPPPNPPAATPNGGFTASMVNATDQPPPLIPAPPAPAPDASTTPWTPTPQPSNPYPAFSQPNLSPDNPWGGTSVAAGPSMPYAGAGPVTPTQPPIAPVGPGETIGWTDPSNSTKGAWATSPDWRNDPNLPTDDAQPVKAKAPSVKDKAKAAAKSPFMIVMPNQDPVSGGRGGALSRGGQDRMMGALDLSQLFGPKT